MYTFYTFCSSCYCFNICFSVELSLRGDAEEPLAEEHLKFKCSARSKEVFSIPLSILKRYPNSGRRVKDKSGAVSPIVAKPAGGAQV